MVGRLVRSYTAAGLRARTCALACGAAARRAERD